MKRLIGIVCVIVTFGVTGCILETVFNVRECVAYYLLGILCGTIVMSIIYKEN